MNIPLEVLSLFIIALPVASLTWAVTHEEVVREFRDFSLSKSKTCRHILERKFFYIFTCEYCFSHYVTAAFLIITRYKLLFPDWRGYLIAGFSLVWVANVGCPQDFVRSGILRDFPVFLKSDVFGVGHRHALRFQQEIAHVLIAATAVDQHTDVTVDSFYHSEANLGPAVVQNPIEVFKQRLREFLKG